MICEGIPGAIPLMQNTDGLETMIPRQYEQKYYDICKEWEELTQRMGFWDHHVRGSFLRCKNITKMWLSSF